MTKVINLELAKRLAPYLENVDTEYWYWHSWAIFTMYQLEVSTSERAKDVWIKTLTFSEIPKFISDYSNNEWRIYCSLLLQKELWDIFSVLEIFDIEMWEKMLTYLLDNNLLWQKN